MPVSNVGNRSSTFNSPVKRASGGKSMKPLPPHVQKLIDQLPQDKQEDAKNAYILEQELIYLLGSSALWMWRDRFENLVKCSSLLGKAISEESLKKVFEKREKIYQDRNRGNKFAPPKRNMNYEESKAWYLKMVTTVT